ncbi:putative ABC transport system ATP-binding protein [Allocatelliglobosispora scoriae]|uniref:Putative ABC transport system ATP-binding protein n=1 Tax=Allocatelliglobosispora scoriae TaxID=643052 RepID=A0A841BKI7_9ACTN|nr:ABC transporter ATP-binding protein [Allocatelliglobosispora scoriae]MBB5867513.1 putative ABC transport system ATP-binding protein [Allocatelliglobosispora scoriae]
MTGAVSAEVLVARRLFRFFRASGEETLAVAGVSLTVRAGERVAVAGPSGSGKSTLLSLLAGLDEPDGGTVRVAGHPVSHRPEEERARIRATSIGMLYQYGNLLDHLTVAQNLRFAHGLAGHRTRFDLAERLEAVGAGGLADVLPAALSGGQAARAGLAVALVNDPPLLIADEPTAELDADAEQQILDLLAAQAAAGTAIVLASHSPRVLAVCDRVIRLRDGQIVADGQVPG